MLKSLRDIALPLILAPLSLAFLPGESNAAEPVRALEQEREPARTSSLEGVSAWMKQRFSKSEMDTYSAEDFRVESHFCSCADLPEPHFPYAVVLFTTPKGDLVARAEPQEQGPRITPLAVRNGEQYCKLEAEEQCYGSFASVCAFTDFRYGPLLEPYFPTCK
jgi:hypothetical protein